MTRYTSLEQSRHDSCLPHGNLTQRVFCAIFSGHDRATPKLSESRTTADDKAAANQDITLRQETLMVIRHYGTVNESDRTLNMEKRDGRMLGLVARSFSARAAS